MARPGTHASPPARRAGQAHAPTFLPITLAGWQLRQTWRLLLVIGAGVIAAVIIICAVPLYSQISEDRRTARHAQC